jgi:hypothetical protein
VAGAGKDGEEVTRERIRSETIILLGGAAWSSTGTPNLRRSAIHRASDDSAKPCGVWTKPLARRTLRVSLARSPG